MKFLLSPKLLFAMEASKKTHKKFVHLDPPSMELLLPHFRSKSGATTTIPDFRHRHRLICTIFALSLTAACFVSGCFVVCGLFLVRANSFGRHCFYVPRNAAFDYRFALVTCTDGGDLIPGRSFDGLTDLVIPNKLDYVKRHGYEFIDASDVLDKSRPPSWSKIIAVRKHLPNFDWIFWNDADSLVTNPDISLNDVIASVMASEGRDTVPDFIVTKDVTGVNAGMFFVRNTEWSRQFLDLWWNQSSFIQPFGRKKSGDNDALKYLMSIMPKEQFKQHVSIPKMQCTFNSYIWSPSPKNSRRLMSFPRTVWQGVYSRGDFMVHLAGLNDKKAWTQRVLVSPQIEYYQTRLPN